MPEGTEPGGIREWVDALGDAAAFPDARIILRSAAGAVAELVGPLELSGGFPEGKEWLRLGQETSSHVHLRAHSLAGVIYRQPDDRNASLEAVGAHGEPLLKVSFGRTNPARPERFSAERREAARRRFGCFAACAGD